MGVGLAESGRVGSPPNGSPSAEEARAQEILAWKTELFRIGEHLRQQDRGLSDLGNSALEKELFKALRAGIRDIRGLEAPSYLTAADADGEIRDVVRQLVVDGIATEAEAPQLSDEALALRFAVTWDGHLKYVDPWGRWYIWTGKRWERDETLHVYDHVRALCREGASTVAQEKKELASRVASARTVAAVERLCRSDRRFAATVDQWDSDPMALNTPEGVVDLRTGKLHPHRPEAFHTKMTSVGPAASPDCPLWLAFLARVMGELPALVAFLQRMVGYLLTGSTQEHALFFLFGLGANGKSVFVNTIMGILGDYATTASTDVFMVSTVDRHPTELAGLRGARLVSATETEQGRRWAESRIKALTGGDRIAARFMRQDFFEFVPRFKLVVSGNHKPGLRTIDEAIRRRLHLLPFSVTIPERERDQHLAEKLKLEWPAILRWAIEGCLGWQREGLNPPAEVRDATSTYLSDQDALGQWLEEQCIRDANRMELTKSLFESWKAWADERGEYVGSEKRFSEALQGRGFEPKREAGTGRRGFRGIGLNVQ